MEEHKKTSNEWYCKSNYLGLLSVKTESELKMLIDKASILDIKYSIFREPDIGNQITAVCLEPGSKTKRLCSKIPLALKD
jgi:hypothetical protein